MFETDCFQSVFKNELAFKLLVAPAALPVKFTPLTLYNQKRSFQFHVCIKQTFEFKMEGVNFLNAFPTIFHHHIWLKKIFLKLKFVFFRILNLQVSFLNLQLLRKQGVNRKARFWLYRVPLA